MLLFLWKDCEVIVVFLARQWNINAFKIELELEYVIYLQNFTEVDNRMSKLVNWW